MNQLSLLSPIASPPLLHRLERILIVDDEPRMRCSLRRLLAAHGREILECDTGGEAINILKSQEITLVLLDVYLPDISGLDVLEWVKSRMMSTSVIIISVADNIDCAIRALRIGAVDYLRKTDELDDIRHKVDNALHLRRLEESHALMAARLGQSERLHRFLVENSPDLIYTLDSSGCFIFINERVRSLLGYSPEELIGRPYASIVHHEDLERAHFAFTERRADERATTNAEIRLKCKDAGYQVFTQHHVVAMLSAVGVYESGHGEPLRQFLGTYGVARDITHRKIAEETISFQALHDQLTSLPNRRLFMDRLEVALTQAMRNHWKVGVMFLDLDHFKLVNDTHGHSMGDELLKSMAHRLRGCVRAGDTVARLGGDEFTVLMPQLTRDEDAAIIATKILEELKRPFQLAGHEFHTSASIGISVFPRDGATADILVRHADLALYNVKGDGKNAFQFFLANMNDSYRERIALENELRQAIANSEFELYYQPKISISAGRIVGMEALLRWRHPVHGLLSPVHFIDLVQQTGLIEGMTEWVLAEACGQLARWRSAGLNELGIAVNISLREFNSKGIVERIISQVARHGLPPESFGIEITEDLLLPNVSGALEKMRFLRSHGVRIAIDDFGTASSSLNYLRSFPVSAIKIDQSFVHDLVEGQPVSPIIHAIVGIARGFGLGLEVEGVETSYQMDMLRELGCDEMQGYLFSPPVSALEAEARLFSPEFSAVAS